MTGGGAVFNIRAGLPFARALVTGLLSRTSGDPAALADVLILLPTRRACRTLRETFLAATDGAPLILPRMMPLGDADPDDPDLANAGDFGIDGAETADIPPAIDPPRRLLLLARLVARLHGLEEAPDRAARLAAELARLLDQVQIERLSFDRLETLVEGELSEHWQKTVRFLEVVTGIWPDVLAEEGLIDPAERRNRLLAARAEAWTRRPPPGPVIAAGSTGSVPATADLLAVVASLPRGAVVLPGLDPEIDDASWEALDPQHPQYNLKRLLGRLGVERRAVADWPAPGVRATPPARLRLIHDALRPAATTDAWRHLGEPDRHALDGMTRIDCPTQREEAAVIALHLREALERDGTTAALVTPDRALARRVAAEMRRWGVTVDDSAGVPLDQTAPGGFLRLLLAAMTGDLAPVPLLALLKHPMATGGLTPGRFRSMSRQLELRLLRGPRIGGGLNGLRQAAIGKGLDDLLDRLDAALGPLAEVFAGRRQPPATLLGALVTSAEALADSDTRSGAERLWSGDAGEAAATFVAELADALPVLDDIDPARLAALVDVLMAGRAVRPRFGAHPRVTILGPLEARLQRADVLILGGLNEGVWPPDAVSSPWMSRPMMAAFGLPAPERRIGLSAHDFVQGACADRVVLTRSRRVEGTPTVPSRWLLRLETLLAGTRGEEIAHDSATWLDWQRRLDLPERFETPAPPEPRPPVAARPRKLSVTRVERWMRDPYSLYAETVLRLRALDPLDADPGAADYGTIIHAVLDRFVRACPPPAAPPPDALDRLLDMGRDAFGETLRRPGVWAFWWPRFERVAAWFVDAETTRRNGTLAATGTELTGELTLRGPAGPFTLTACADRVDRWTDGTLTIIDYKTGTAPTAKSVASGKAPQLPLEGAIARARDGGFPAPFRGATTALEYWRLKGGREPGEIKSAGRNVGGLIDEAEEGLRGLIAKFDFEDTPYRAVPPAENAPDYSHYTHLARFGEWATLDEEANGE